MAEYVLEARGVVKTFPGVRALDGVHLRVRPGEIHAVVGENGAGKSTLMLTLTGVHRPDEGEILIDGRPVSFESRQDAVEQGISIVFQELSLVPSLSVAENIFANRQPVNRLGYIDQAALHRQTREALALFDLEGLDPATPVRTLSPATQQVVEILKAISTEPKVLILDEPTSSLTEVETRRLFENLRRLTARGLACLYISHHLNEIFQNRRHRHRAPRRRLRLRCAGEGRRRGVPRREHGGAKDRRHLRRPQPRCRARGGALRGARRLWRGLRRGELHGARGRDRRLLGPGGRRAHRACARHLRRRPPHRGRALPRREAGPPPQPGRGHSVRHRLPHRGPQAAGPLPRLHRAGESGREPARRALRGAFRERPARRGGCGGGSARLPHRLRRGWKAGAHPLRRQPAEGAARRLDRHRPAPAPRRRAHPRRRRRRPQRDLRLPPPARGPGHGGGDRSPPTSPRSSACRTASTS